jgi:hypothetical protein
MTTQILKLASKSKIALFTVVFVVMVAACTQEPDLDVDLKERTPASFVFSGRSLASSFEILEVPRTKPLSKTNPFSFTGTTIWKISAPQEIRGAQWPSITYGEVPNGFSQTIPDHGPPPILTVEKLYAAQIVGDKDTKTALFFEIRNGKPVNVSDEVLGP